MAAAPLVSVIVRSYNRIPTLCDLLTALLDQRHDSFEIVIVEQSTTAPSAAAARLADLARDPRIRMLRRPPLGGPAARNVGVRSARGEILVFIDDDDLPVGRDWLAAHLANYADPHCLGVTGRQRSVHPHEASPWYTRAARTRCMGFMPVLKLPTTYVRHGARVRPVQAVHGTNGSLRRSAVVRFGGWDEDTTVEDETSFSLRARPLMHPGEYFVFDPIPEVIRGLGTPGGLAKRFMTATGFFVRLLDFVHTILGRYFPVRVFLLYPVYAAVAYGWTVGWLWLEAGAYRRRAWPRKLAATVLFTTLAPFHLVRALSWSWSKRQTAMTPERMWSVAP
jgi:glycosyltransferase involved in cell wall biosynthesis